MMSRFFSQIILLWLTMATIHRRTVQSYTYEPPGKDPISIGKIRTSEQAVQLTTENYDELTSGKLVFIKFYAPYCPHCNAMAPAWNELATYYQTKGDDNVLIGSVDCTDSPRGKTLCMRFKLTGLPTLLYGPTSYNGVYLEEYGGDKSFDHLKSFALKELVPKCLPGSSLEACTSEERQQMEKYLPMSYSELNNVIHEEEEIIKNAQMKFKEKKNEMQKYYDTKLMEKEMKATKIKAEIKMIEGMREKLKRDEVKTEL